MAGRFGVSRYAYQSSGSPSAASLGSSCGVWGGTGAFVLGETLLQKQPGWWNCLAITTGLFLGCFEVASLSFRQSSSIGEKAQWGLEDSHL